jgi:hypothetical protein
MRALSACPCARLLLAPQYGMHGGSQQGLPARAQRLTATAAPAGARAEFEAALQRRGFAFSVLVHSDPASALVDFLPSSSVLQVPPHALRWHTPTLTPSCPGRRERGMAAPDARERPRLRAAGARDRAGISRGPGRPPGVDRCVESGLVELRAAAGLLLTRSLDAPGLAASRQV